MDPDRPGGRRFPVRVWVAIGVAVLIGLFLLSIDNRWAHLAAFLLATLSAPLSVHFLARK
jgi:MFS-type transporter involved in bile tolerance (Atg22 family)